MRKPKKMLPPDWVIHMVANGVKCDACGETEDVFPDYICNAHTHGMAKYNHVDFQMVLHVSQQEICYVLNALGDRVRSGERFNAGDMVNGIFEDCPVRLDMFQECNRTVLRVIIPDGQNRFPEDKHCKYPYSFQTFTLEALEAMKASAEGRMA